MDQNRSTNGVGAALIVACLLAGLVTACAAPETGQQRLNSVMVGSDVVLPAADTAAISEIGVELSGLAAPLSQWWSSLNDPAVPATTWLAQAPALLAQMTTVVDRIEARLGPDRDVHVRDTFAPYVAGWREILATLDRVRDRVAAADTVGQQAAADDYNTQLRRIRALDAARVQRVVDVLGRDDARRLLEAEGVDPGRFGLGP
jgi:hypothetical protein